jgi:hypothetical protein
MLAQLAGGVVTAGSAGVWFGNSFSMRDGALLCANAVVVVAFILVPMIFLAAALCQLLFGVRK